MRGERIVCVGRNCEPHAERRRIIVPKNKIPTIQRKEVLFREELLCSDEWDVGMNGDGMRNENGKQGGVGVR